LLTFSLAGVPGDLKNYFWSSAMKGRLRNSFREWTFKIFGREA
jgi:hypothetical protein